ncbi:hypothetical protein BXZ70DRAFT_901587 [Cristinia sonorae]|uniref:DUF6533 domain-containing protein n=1 Tax=Cristinia sonorae TaxID=1940300 RepID=A0A8K0UG63_9AGAR|nr:hypothetical protein BXZ70DRAFT_901587 [Cristinia sonorae]
MSAPPPGFAQIPLPPGMTLEQFQTLQGQIVTISITVAVATGILLWDYFTLLRDEISLYRNEGRRFWKTPGTILFIILRYAGILAMIPSLFFTSVQSSHCQASVSISQAGVLLAVAAAGGIFCFRVFALWNGNHIVHGVVGCMYCLMMACWIAVGSQYRATQGPPTPFGSNCQMQPIVSWAPISFASSVAFDTVVLALTLAKIHVNAFMTSSSIGRQVYRDNLMYFLITTVTNTVVLAIESLGPEHTMIKPTAVPFSTLVTVTMGSRVYLNLRLMHKRADGARSDTTRPSFTTHLEDAHGELTEQSFRPSKLEVYRLDAPETSVLSSYIPSRYDSDSVFSGAIYSTPTYTG